ncbi:MAG: hypothetical protein ACR2QF_13290 [Geminicoccaceae bacterium]
MTRKYPIAAAAIMVLLSAEVEMAAAQDASASQLCAITQLLECIDGDACYAIAPERIGAPRFLRVENDGQQIRNPQTDSQAPGATVVHSERIDGKLILQGTDPGVEDLRDGVAWSVAIVEDAGSMVLTAAGEKVAYVAFGDCLAMD